MNWQERAACRGVDPETFHAKSAPGQLHAITTWCLGCPVRAECLADALDLPGDRDYGVFGGTTRPQRLAYRQRPDLPTGQGAAAIAALRQLLDQEQPNVPRHPAPRTPRRAAREKTKVNDKPTTAQAPVDTEPETPATSAAPAAAAPVRSISDLLDWGEQHADTNVRKYAKQARGALTVLQQRHAVDAELETVLREAGQMRQRLAELDARAKQLGAPAKAKRDHDPKVVRAWAREQGLECPKLGVVPKAVLAKWREATAA